MKNFRALFLLALGIMLCATVGCGGGNSDSQTAPAPVSLINLSGSLVVPTTVNSQLLTSVRSAQNTDSEVRNAFAGASVWVNDAAISLRVITPSALSSTWDIKLQSVPTSSSGVYKIHLVVGRLIMKAWVKKAQMESFTINSQTTAAALLAETAKLDANDVIATFPAMVSQVANQIELAFNAAGIDVKTNILALPGIQNEVASQADFLAKNKDFNPSSLVAYLGASNDLDGNGVPDVKILQTTDRTGIRFETALSSHTTLLSNIASLTGYADSTLITDFAAGNTRTDRTFDATGKNFGLGLFLSKSAAGDRYLKLFVRRIDLAEGTFKGVYAEYALVTATGTAIATGTKKLSLVGTAPAASVEATNFLTDTIATAGYLVYLSTEKGIGSPDGSTRLIRAVDGKPELANLSSAETYIEGLGNYHIHAQNALKAVNKTRSLEIGDVFSAYFKNTRHYALFKVKAIDAQSVTVDYRVNSAVDEPRF